MTRMWKVKVAMSVLIDKSVCPHASGQRTAMHVYDERRRGVGGGGNGEVEGGRAGAPPPPRASSLAPSPPPPAPSPRAHHTHAWLSAVQMHADRQICR